MSVQLARDIFAIIVTQISLVILVEDSQVKFGDEVHLVLAKTVNVRINKRRENQKLELNVIFFLNFNLKCQFLTQIHFLIEREEPTVPRV